MKSQTRQALHAINRAFYAHAADGFSAAREKPWPGWDRVMATLPREDRDLSVLDIGCGNGRLAAYLAERWTAGGERGTANLRYLGIDQSEPLLRIARGRGLNPDCFRFLALDFIQNTIDHCLEADSYSLITVYGVLHHIPGYEQRRELLASLLGRLSERSRLAVTFWRFAIHDRFLRKIISWQRYNKQAQQPIDIHDLEPGDHLLPWGAENGPPRYCHFADDDEIETLLSSLDAICVDRFEADGEDNRLNLYLVLAPEKHRVLSSI